MKLSWEYLAGSAILVVAFLLAWFSGGWLHVVGANLWVLRAGIVALGIILVAALFLWARSRQPEKPAAVEAKPAAEGAAPGLPADDIKLLVREAETRLSSSALRRGTKLNSLPAIFVLGEAGSGKTSTVVHCGLEPELLAGQALQEGAVVPTRAANFWFAHNSLLLEVGGKLVADSKSWAQLISLLAPSKFQSILSRKQQAPRAAVVCVDCEKLAKATTPEPVVAAARNLRERLSEMAAILGISFPVYVLFNKADKLPFFEDYVSTLNDEEASQVLGLTLAVPAGQSTGTYGEQETARLAGAFRSLFYSLCEWRTELLSREHDGNKQAGIYEFPRQFRKLCDPKLQMPAVQFLVDLCRPSQLSTTPFLRGFYFVGQRTVAMSMAPLTMLAQKSVVRQAMAAPASATRMLRQEDLAGLDKTMLGTQLAGGAGAESRKVAQPVFLGHIFSNILLQDHAALGASSKSAKVNLWRRVGLAAVAAAGLLLSIGLIVSYFGNQGLESRVVKAARAIDFSQSPGSQLASQNALRQLDTLRQSLEVLSQYRREGVPWRLRWGLYVGDRIYPSARQIYFQRFRQLLFGQSQGALRQTLLQFPSTPGPTDDYSSAYATLKAYLITTSNPEKSTRDFLPPVLMQKWLAGRDVDDERRQLAQKQFDFYSDELKIANPYSGEPDAPAVDRGRRYLAQFAAVQRIYYAMLADAAKKNPPINFNKAFPDAADVVRDNHEVPGAFSRTGWSFMQDALRHPDRYFSGEEWVLGPQAATSLDRAKLEQDLRALYQSDFLKQWREFLNAGTVLHAASVPEISRKLLKLSGNQSPLLALLCQASYNTAIDSPDVQKAFQPPQYVVPPGCQEQYIQPPNAPYINALLKLQNCLDQMSGVPPEQKEAMRLQCNAVASDAKLATRQVAQGFRIDPEAHVERTVQRLMEEAIMMPGVAPPPGPGQLCAQFRALMGDYPFNRNSTRQAEVQAINAIFQPNSGALSQYVQSLGGVLVRQGQAYLPNPSSPAKLAPGVIEFVNRGTAIQQALYPGGSQLPQFAYALKWYPSQGIDSLTLVIDGRSHRFTAADPTMQFVWPATGAQGVTLTAKLTGGSELTFLTYSGLWAVSHFLAEARTAGNHMEWLLSIGGQPALSNGQPIKVIFDLDTKGAPAIILPGALSGVSCPAKVSH